MLEVEPKKSIKEVRFDPSSARPSNMSVMGDFDPYKNPPCFN